MNAGHTPGPWFTFANGQCVGGPVGPLGNPSGAETAGIAHCGMGLRTGTEIQANARLCAAAPDTAAMAMAFTLLVERYVRYDEGAQIVSDTELADAMYALRAHIAKATGDAS